MKTINKWANVICGFFVFCVSFLIISRYSMLGIDPLHQGFILKTAGDVADGMTLFSETYTQHGSLPIYVSALAIRFLGKSIWAINLAAILFEGIAYVYLFNIVNLFLNKFWGILVCVFTLTLGYFYFWEYHPWSSVYALSFLMGTCYYMLKYIMTNSYKYTFLAGIFTALTFWSRIPVGMVLVLAVFIIMIMLLIDLKFRKASIKRWGIGGLIFLGGLIIVHALFLAVILKDGSITDWYNQCVKGMVTYTSNKAGATSKQKSIVWVVLSYLIPALWYNAVWYVIPLYNLLVFAVVSIYSIFFGIVKKNWIVNQKLLAFLAYLVIATASWHQYYPVVCYRHLYWAFFPMLGACVISLCWILEKVSKKVKLPYAGKNVIILVILAILLFPEWKYRIEEGRTYKEGKEEWIVNEEYPYVNYLRFEEAQKEFYNDLFTTIEQVKNDYPNKNIMNKCSVGLFSCFHLENITPEFIDRGASSCYENADEIKKQYIYEERPIIIAYVDRFHYSGYELYKEITGDSGDIYNGDSNVGIFVPTNDVTIDMIDQIYGKQMVNGSITLEPDDIVNGPAAVCFPGSYSIEIQCEIPKGEKVGCVIYADGEQIAGQYLKNGDNIINCTVFEYTDLFDISICNTLDKKIKIKKVNWKQNIYTEEKWEDGIAKIIEEYSEYQIINTTDRVVPGMDEKKDDIKEEVMGQFHNYLILSYDYDIDILGYELLDVIGDVKFFAPSTGERVKITSDMVPMNDVICLDESGYELKENGILHGPYQDIARGEYRLNIIGDYNNQKLGYTISVGDDEIVRTGVLDEQNHVIEFALDVNSNNFKIIIHNPNEQSIMISDIELIRYGELKDSLLTLEKVEKVLEQLVPECSSVINHTLYNFKYCDKMVDSIEEYYNTADVIITKEEIDILGYHKILSSGDINVFRFMMSNEDITDKMLTMDHVENEGDSFRLYEGGILHGPYEILRKGEYSLEVDRNSDSELGYQIIRSETGEIIEQGQMPSDNASIDFSVDEDVDSLVIILHNPQGEQVINKVILNRKGN